jgi:hypothetical protein
MDYNQILTQCPASGSGVHSWMMTVANIGARDGVDAGQVADDIRKHMTRNPTSGSEVTETVRKAYAEKGESYTPDVKTPEEKAFQRELVAKMQSRAFLRLAGDPIEMQELANISPVDVKCIQGYESHTAAKLLLYLYDRHELVWCGEMYGGQEGLKTVEQWAESFLCCDEVPPLFIPNPMTGKGGKTKSGKESYRCDETVAEWRYALFEVDHEEITLGHQAAFWKRQIEKEDGIPVEAITYSGGKSLHALIRVDCKTEVEWDKKVRNGAFPAWMRLGADKSCRNPSRLSRLPGHMRDGERLQSLLYLRGGK